MFKRTDIKCFFSGYFASSTAELVREPVTVLRIVPGKLGANEVGVLAESYLRFAISLHTKIDTHATHEP